MESFNHSNQFKCPLTAEETRVVRKRRRRHSTDRNISLPVYVSDEHNGALNNIHCAIRLKELGFRDISVLHIDSHPDMSIPIDMSASLVFQPRELQHHLDASVTGIAEFILPLAYAGHIDRVFWIRPPWSDQICDGEMSFHIGNISGDGNGPRGPLRVTSTAPYFADEGMAAEFNCLENLKPVRLAIGQANIKTESCIKFLGLEENREWILDICLDYFSVQNPFFIDMLKAVSEDHAQLLRDVFCGKGLQWTLLERYRTANATEAESRRLEQYELKRSCCAAIDSLFEHVISESCDDAEENRIIDRVSENYADTIDGKEKATKLLKLLRNSSSAIIQLAKENGPNLDLPHHVTDQAVIDTMMKDLEDILNKVSVVRRPSIVTIAESSSDGFTPLTQKGPLLETVLAMLRRIFGPIEVEYDVNEYLQ